MPTLMQHGQERRLSPLLTEPRVAAEMCAQLTFFLFSSCVVITATAQNIRCSDIACRHRL